MKIEKKLLFFVLFLGVFFHAGGIYILHDFPLSSGVYTFRKSAIYFSADLEKQKRNQQLAEIFFAPEPTFSEIKQELSELMPLQTSPFPITLPSKESLAQNAEVQLSFSVDSTFPIDQKDSFVWDKDEFFEIHPPNPFANEIPLQEKIPFDSDYSHIIGSIANSDHFSINVEYMPRCFRPGYVFKVTFTPKSEVIFKPIGQNYYFLIDRSNSIPRARYFLNKKAVAQALSYLRPQDTFNILIFDDRVIRFVEKNLPWNEKNVAIAKEFLQSQGHGGYFAATELYASLGKIIPQNVSDTEVNTAILLSDGDTYLTLEKQRQTIGKWTTKNRGKVSLFCLASGKGNNLALLELISSFNKGKLVYASQHQDIAERLQQLIYSLQNPIGKAMVATAVSSDKQIAINLQPKNGRLPDLYENHPFVILGATNRVSDFTLFLQGRYYDRRFDIKKKISFANATSGTLSLERQWTELLAQDYYEFFFQDGKQEHLEAARQMLAPLNISVPFLRKK